jgi:hypothetical protein
MAWTKQEYDTLKRSIAQGAFRVRYGDKEVEYRSLPEMRETLAMMEKELGIRKPGSNKKFVQFSKGLQ